MTTPIAVKGQRLEHATWKGDGRDYGPYRSGPYRLVLHSTETRTLPGYNDGNSAPHVTFNPLDLAFTQHLGFDRSAGAMRNAAGGVETNADGAIQIEVICYSDHRIADEVKGLRSDQLSDRAYTALAAAVAGIGRAYSIPMTPYPQKITDGRCYGTNSPCRMTNGEWDQRVLLDGTPWGVCGHRNVPENTHWDPGSIDIVRICNEAYQMLTAPVPSTPELPTSRFSDVPINHWAHEDVEFLADIGIVKGQGPGIFDPESSPTRAEMAALIARAIRYTKGTP